jgi:hypothetical protein
MESKNRNVWIIVILLLVVAVCCCAAAVAATAAGFFALDRSTAISWGIEPVVDLGRIDREHVNQTFEVGDAPELDITNFAGLITIRSGPEGAISVAATKEAGTQRNLEGIELHMTQSGDRVTIKTRTQPRVSNTRVNLEIDVPAGTRVEVDQGAGEVSVRGLAAPIQIRTGAGNVTIRDVSSSLEVNSGAGTVNVHRASGPVRLDLGAGDVHYEGDPDGDCRFHTAAGNINLRLPANPDVNVDLGCGLGQVRVDYAVQGRVKAREVKGVIGDGSQATIDAYSALGNVNLAPR